MRMKTFKRAVGVGAAGALLLLTANQMFYNHRMDAKYERLVRNYYQNRGIEFSSDKIRQSAGRVGLRYGLTELQMRHLLALGKTPDTALTPEELISLMKHPASANRMNLLRRLPIEPAQRDLRAYNHALRIRGLSEQFKGLDAETISRVIRKDRWHEKISRFFNRMERHEEMLELVRSHSYAERKGETKLPPLNPYDFFPATERPADSMRNFLEKRYGVREEPANRPQPRRMRGNGPG
ncbi:MAG: hypothetical protein ABIG96_00625 [Candidatus Micrarchaeota archaeon]